MVDHDVAQGADRVIKVGAVLDADGLGHRDLNIGDVVAVPDRLEHRVGEAQVQDLLEAHLAEVVIDPEELGLVQILVKLCGQCPCRLEIVPERLLYHDPLAGVEQTLLLERADHLPEERRGDLQVERGVLAVAECRLDTVVGGAVTKVTADVLKAPGKALEHVLVQLLATFLDRGTGSVHQLLYLPVLDRHTDHWYVQQVASLEPVERAECHLARQVSGDPEDDEGVGWFGLSHARHRTRFDARHGTRFAET